MNNFFCIYRIVNLINNKTYIGQHRYRDSQNPMKDYWGSGYILKGAIKKYGTDNFKKEIIYSRIRDKATADAMEIYAIKNEKLVGHAEYNISTGGTGGDLGEEVRKKQSYSAKHRKVSTHKNTIFRCSLEKQWNRWIRYFCNYSGYYYCKRKFIWTESAIKKREESKKGYAWYNNGKIEIKCVTPPEGYVKGRIAKPNLGKKFSDEYRHKLSVAHLKHKEEKAL